jgi:hypothetical protein
MSFDVVSFILCASLHSFCPYTDGRSNFCESVILNAPCTELATSFTVIHIFTAIILRPRARS